MRARPRPEGLGTSWPCSIRLARRVRQAHLDLVSEGLLSDTKSNRTSLTRIVRLILYPTLALALLYVLACLLEPFTTGVHPAAKQGSWIKITRILAFAELSYANDNDGKYPGGKSSTEICQKLLDGNYISGPAIFYVPFPGKVKAVKGQRLNPENVCWDFTGRSDASGLDPSDPDSIPVVYLTCYQVEFVAGGSATPRIKPYPFFGDADETRSVWWKAPQFHRAGLYQLRVRIGKMA